MKLKYELLDSDEEQIQEYVLYYNTVNKFLIYFKFNTEVQFTTFKSSNGNTIYFHNLDDNDRFPQMKRVKY